MRSLFIIPFLAVACGSPMESGLEAVPETNLVQCQDGYFCSIPAKTLFEDKAPVELEFTVDIDYRCVSTYYMVLSAGGAAVDVAPRKPSKTKVVGFGPVKLTDKAPAWTEDMSLDMNGTCVIQYKGITNRLSDNSVTAIKAQIADFQKLNSYMTEINGINDYAELISTAVTHMDPVAVQGFLPSLKTRVDAMIKKHSPDGASPNPEAVTSLTPISSRLGALIATNPSLDPDSPFPGQVVSVVADLRTATESLQSKFSGYAAAKKVSINSSIGYGDSSQKTELNALLNPGS